MFYFKFYTFVLLCFSLYFYRTFCSLFFDFMLCFFVKSVPMFNISVIFDVPLYFAARIFVKHAMIHDEPQINS